MLGLGHCCASPDSSGQHSFVFALELKKGAAAATGQLF